MFYKEIISVQNKLYIVERKIRISSKPIVDNWKEHLKVDKVFKKEPFFYFVTEIIDVEPI